MESMRDIDRAMEREIAKGSCPLRFIRIEFGDSPYQEIASREKLLEVLSYLLRTGILIWKQCGAALSCRKGNGKSTR